MSTTGNRVTTRSKNASQHPGHLVPKQSRRTTQEIAAIREAKVKDKEAKELTKMAGIKRVAAFEKSQADDDAMEQTPKVQMKSKPLVRTRSYADVLRGDDIDEQSAEPDSAFEAPAAHAADGQTTESEGMETVVERPLAPPRKKMKTEKKDRKGKAPGVRDTIKAIQDAPEKNCKYKKAMEAMEASDSESMKIDATPKPNKKSRRKAPPTEPEDDLPAGPPKRVRRPAMTEEEDSEDLPSKMKEKGKSKERPARFGADHLAGKKVSKSVI
jgi:hypothetical protein